MRPRHAITAGILPLLLLATPFGRARAQPAPTATEPDSGAWELSVCSGGDNLPYSARDESGFENLMMRELADELGARLDYLWLPRLRNVGRDRQLLADGACDVFLDVGAGGEGYLATLDYLQSTYVYIGKQTVLDQITELTLADLQGLRVGVVATSPPDIALGLQGDVGPLVHYVGGLEPAESAMVDDLLAGNLDVAIAWGPQAAYLASQHQGVLALKTVTPEIDLNGISMVNTSAMGVRAGDTELRDLLNKALAARWPAIEKLFVEQGVPVVPLPRPILSLQEGETSNPDQFRVGVIVPIPMGDQSLEPYGEQFVGEAAARGATLALETFPSAAAGSLDLEILITSAHGSAAVKRAAERLRFAEGITAVVGGFSNEEATVLATSAEENDFVFMNVGASSDVLRSAETFGHTFHVAASDAMYWSALLDQSAAAGDRHWLVVHSDAPTDSERYSSLLAAAAAAGTCAPAMADVPVQVAQPLYTGALDAVTAADPDLVVLVLDPFSQERFRGQLATSAAPPQVVGYPDFATQTRDYIAAALYETPELAATPRLAQWEATLTADGADELNRSFVDRFGHAMDPAAWSTYTAIAILVEARQRAASVSADALAALLETPGTFVEAFKGPGTAFDEQSHQLAQPLYVVLPDPEADVTDVKRLDLVVLSATLPGRPVPQCD